MARTKPTRHHPSTRGKRPLELSAVDSEDDVVDSEDDVVDSEDDESTVKRLKRLADKLKRLESSQAKGSEMIDWCVSEMQKRPMPWLVTTIAIDEGFPQTLWIPYSHFSPLLKKYLPPACAGSPLLDYHTPHHSETWYPANAPEAAELKEVWRSFGNIYEDVMRKGKDTGVVDAERMVGWTMTVVRR